MQSMENYVREDRYRGAIFKSVLTEAGSNEIVVICALALGPATGVPYIAI